jgi:hypothetical protein
MKSIVDIRPPPHPERPRIDIAEPMCKTSRIEHLRLEMWDALRTEIEEPKTTTSKIDSRHPALQALRMLRQDPICTDAITDVLKNDAAAVIPKTLNVDPHLRKLRTLKAEATDAKLSTEQALLSVAEMRRDTAEPNIVESSTENLREDRIALRRLRELPNCT